jgi:hypothetical protein
VAIRTKLAEIIPEMRGGPWDLRNNERNCVFRGRVFQPSIKSILSKTQEKNVPPQKETKS